MLIAGTLITIVASAVIVLIDYLSILKADTNHITSQFCQLCIVATNDSGMFHVKHIHLTNSLLHLSVYTPQKLRTCT